MLRRRRRSLNKEEAFVDDFLAHYGVLGMRWGRRKADTHSMDKKVNRLEAKDKRSADYKRKEVLKRKALHEMSNEEIKQLTTRLQLEKQYKDLSDVDLAPGRKFVKDVYTNAGKQTATNYVSKFMVAGVEAAIAGIVLKKTLG